MESMIQGIFSLPVANFLIIAGISFLLIAVVGDISGKIAPGKIGRIAAGTIGVVTLAGGLVIHILEKPSTSQGTAIDSTKKEALTKEDTTMKAQMSSFEYAVNRLAFDYKSFEVTEPQECRDACASETPCLAFTYVKPGIQGVNANCWLKNTVPAPTPDNCCISGVKQ